MEYDLFQISVKALVYSADRKLLLIKDEKGEWDLPGGRINYGEKFIDALQRECKEELGVNCKILKPVPDYVWTGINTAKAWRINLCFKTQLDSDNFAPSDENVEHGYFSLDEARKLNLAPHLNNLNELHD